MPNERPWHNEHEYHRALAETCAADLAEHLPGTWDRRDPHEHLVAIASGEQRLLIRPMSTGSRWRIVITADLPSGYSAHTHLTPKETSVAADRPPAHIAGQVRRRLLTPEYHADIQTVHTALATERDRQAALAVALAEIESFLPGARPYPHDGEGYTRFAGPDLLRGSFRFTYNAAKADIELDWVPVDLARDIAALIGKHLDANRANGPGGTDSGTSSCS